MALALAREGTPSLLRACRFGRQSGGCGRGLGGLAALDHRALQRRSQGRSDASCGVAQQQDAGNSRGLDETRRRLLSRCGQARRARRSRRCHGRRRDPAELCLARHAVSRRKPGPARMLEARAWERGASRCTLISTETARRFYRARGYAETAPSVRKFGMDSGYPMSKDLAPPTVLPGCPGEV